ncbi:MAG: flavin reductase family protein, partial [Asgard group archaeon]|nr:flavin reductase family protein [Asgard group archaeon]
MEKIIFTWSSGPNDPESIILASSIRENTGVLAEAPIWLFIPKDTPPMSVDFKKKMEELKVEIFYYSITEERQFPFIAFVSAAAEAEKQAKGKTELMVWLDTNIVFINEPKEFLLTEDKKIGYKQVHHTLIGSEFDKPLDKFWKMIYDEYNVSGNLIFPMKTHVDGKTLRPYINSGFMVVRPEVGFIQKWCEAYNKMYKDPRMKEYYEKSGLYYTFTHQAILSALLLTSFSQNEMLQLPFSYNYPFHLYLESPEEYRYKDSNDLVVARYYMKKLLDEGGLEKINLKDPFKSWFAAIIDELYNNNSSNKIKLGKTPLIYPVPMILAGSLVHGKPNFELLGDVCILGIKPAIICISSGNTHYTNIGILEHQTFSLNIPNTKLISKMDYCGTVSGKDVDKSELFDVFFGELETAPMIKECPVNIECKVIKEFSIEHRQIFVAEVIQTYVN